MTQVPLARGVGGERVRPASHPDRADLPVPTQEGDQVSDTCGTCKFSASVPEPKYPGLIECRRRPPMPGGRPVADWPQVPAEGWCGEFETAAPPPKTRAKRPAAGEVETRDEQG